MRAAETVVARIDANASRVDGIKLSLLDEDFEVALRRRLPVGVRRYTGDDSNYPALIRGVVVDTYHLWWDDQVRAQIARAGRESRIACFQIADRVTPPPAGVLLGRGLPGTGCVELRRFREAVDAVGCTGPVEIGVFAVAEQRRRPRPPPDR